MFVAANKSWVGIQRKEISDLLKSTVDGRLYSEVAQMQWCEWKILIVEGEVNWTTDGVMVRQFGKPWTLKQWRGLLWSVRKEGIWVEFTANIDDTYTTLEWLKDWFTRDKHSSLKRRPGPVSLWGNPTNEDYKRHLVMGLPGVGPELADRIVKKFGVPFRWSIRVEDLMTIEGVGRKKAESIWAGIGE